MSHHSDRRVPSRPSTGEAIRFVDADLPYDPDDEDYVPDYEDDGQEEYELEMEDDIVDEMERRGEAELLGDLDMEDDEEEENSVDEDTPQPAVEEDNPGPLAFIQSLLGQGEGVQVGTVDFQRLLMALSAPQYQSSMSSGHNANDEEEDEETTAARQGFMARLLRRRAPPAPAEPEKFYPTITEPQEKGLEMLMGGEFGRLSNKYYEQNPRRGPRNLARLVRERHIAKRRMPAADLASNIRPNSSGTIVAAYRENANAYSGQFSADSSFYYTCCHDFRLHVYDTTAPLRKKPQKFVDHETTMKVIKTIQGYPVSWTITDSHLSSDNQRLIYAAIAPQLFMTSTTDSDTSHHVIDFTDTGARRGRIRGRIVNEDHFGLWSCRFSADDKEIVAGGDGNIFVYDLVGDRRTVRISAHSDDVNSCCWADTASGNVLISASDDSFIKVWDRRSLGSSPKPSGVLVGHTEGITYVSPKGDGRYVISNGKDQALRLWDLRMMRSNQEYETFAHRSYGVRGYDYRMGDYHKPKFSAHPKDCSVMVYSGHAVYRTLIRCHFSPTESTGAQYIYSGSADGKIHIWSLDGQIVEVLDRQQTLPMVMDPSAADPVGKLLRKPRRVCVRDVSWHSQEPVLMSTAWEGQRGYGGDSTIARHEWKGLLKTGSGTGAGLLEDHVEKREKEQEEVSTRRYTRLPQTSAVPGAFGSYDVEEDDDDSEWMDEDD